MYELAEAPGFEHALRRFVGSGRATWYETNTDRTHQLLEIFRGASSNRTAVGPDLLRFDACYPHICTIRAVLFITRTGVMRGAALIYPDCLGDRCTGGEGLRVTILRDRRYPGAADLARQWAEQDVTATNARFSFAREVIARVAVEDVASPSAAPVRRISRTRR
jgi:hypothetical protein